MQNLTFLHDPKNYGEEEDEQTELDPLKLSHTSTVSECEKTS